ncbi:MAG TPA: hypothetical protein VJL07_02635 [Dehalococcoidia bacterium]|nr:hypothetical protein [Dehalococcoidia bacterium]
MASKIQTVIFSKEKSPSGVNGGKGWTVDACKKWLAGHEMKHDKSDENEAGYRFRQFPPEDCKAGSFKTLTDNMPMGMAMVSCDTAKQAGVEDSSCDGYFEAMRAAQSAASERQPPDPGSSAEDASEGAHVWRAFLPEMKHLDIKNRRATHLISDSTIDRMGDIIEAEGWDVTDYLANPVVLADHRYSVFSIIGSAREVEKTREGLYATTEFGDHELGQAAFELVRSKLARAWSVGFKTRKAEFAMDGKKRGCEKCAAIVAKKRKEREVPDDEPLYVGGIHFHKQELLEYSLVAIPANPSAVMRSGVRGGRSILPLFEIRSAAEIDSLLRATEKANAGEPDQGSASLGTTVRRSHEDEVCDAILDAQARIRNSNLSARVWRAADEVRKR